MKVTCVLTLAVLILTIGQIANADSTLGQRYCKASGSWCGIHKHRECCSGNCFFWCVYNGK
uniref:Conotoxin Cal6.30 n=1 Tax=Californiconus californicus TaxID=1736779 RepID=C630_CONCL|nr:RecName: Full=Conotoxin Cal6.30; AltName: Full=O1_cal6.30; Flags: Precursor [Californiconus californicus]